MIFGPLPSIFVEKLKAILEEGQAPYKVFHSESEIENFQENSQNEGVNIYPSFSGVKDFLYLEIEKEHIFLIRSELEKMIGPIVPKYQGELDGPAEYLCTACDFLSSEQGLCPKHGIRLLEYSDWIRTKAFQKHGGKYRPFWAFAIVFLFVGLFVFIVTRK